MNRTIGIGGGIGGVLAMLLTSAAPARQAQPAPVAQPAPQPAPAAPASLPRTQALYDGYVRAGKMPGIVGAFGVGDRPTRFVSAGRLADGVTAASAGPDSLWRVYSMTKPVTAMAAMILVEEGRLRLDQPVSDFFPGFAHMRVLTDADHSLASRPATRPITIRNLLTHTAGLGYGIVTKGPLLHEYERLGIMPYTLDPRTEAQLRAVRPASLAEFARRVSTLPLIADPGTRWSYSIGLDVMGAVIEKASGMPFDAFVQARLLAPLGMNSTFWQVPARDAGRLATAYAFVGDARVPVDPAATSPFLQRPNFPYGGAGLVTSARDYDRFLHMLLDGGTLDGVRVMKPETVALATSNLLPAGVFFERGGMKLGYGAGGYVTLADMPGGAGRGTYGWEGIAGTKAWIDPSRHLRATIMVNYLPGDRWPVREDSARALFADAAGLR